MSTDFHFIAIIEFVLIVFLLVMLAFTGLLLSQSKRIVNCTVLTYGEAQKALATHPNLDRDHDGFACEKNGN